MLMLDIPLGRVYMTLSIVRQSNVSRGGPRIPRVKISPQLTFLPGVSMSRLVSLLIFLPMMACGSADGTWEGECVIDDTTIEMQLELTVQGSDASGDAIAGFDDAGYLVFADGDISGTVKGGTLELELDFENGTTLSIQAEQDGDAIDGSCENDAGDGDLELDR